MPHYNKKEGETMTSADLTVLEPYCKDNMRLLKKLSKSIFLRLNEPLTEADYDDFYSIAKEVFQFTDKLCERSGNGLITV